ncbi:uncharacterized protein LOC111791812 [Cucurbita pepo subsp. pepo]|uniref:uncharacterized protein LOC111791812 n=1 Tax=Cucurbita pepo subsp. pepo TaxID=3664 RepID=UPI000C9D2845|nr:uncharacterized protein LOC111791812 [Cucurbita pepo subsp. pepo]
MKGLGLRNKERVEGGKRLLVSVNVVGSSGPLRFVAKEEDLVSEVIHAALKSYARQARLPHLGTHASNFLLYSSNSEDPYASLNPMETIGSKQARNFVLCKKAATASPLPADQNMKKLMTLKESHGWKAWINKSLSSYISYYIVSLNKVILNNVR